MPDVPDPAAAAAVRAVPGRTDVVVAAITWAVAVAGLLALPALSRMDPAEPVEVPDLGSGPWWGVLLALTVQAVAVAWARALPVPALLTVAAVPVLLGALGPTGAVGLVTVAPVVVVYRAVLARPRVRGVLVVVAVLIAVAGVLDGGRSPSGLLVAAGQGVLLVALGLVPALVVGSRRAVREAQAGELRALARERDALVRTAVATERTAMARELHDIAAHHLSGIALMAAAIDRQIDTDPQAARQGLREVREQSRVVLTDLRRLVGLLREDDTAEVSAWNLASVPDLVGSEHATVRVLRASWDLGAGIGPLAQLAAYRMVQESLANARSHAPGAAVRVVVDDTDPAVLVVTVENAASTAEPVPGAAGGNGLRGMAERAALVGATLRHGPTVAGGWQVRLAVPREADGAHEAAGSDGPVEDEQAGAR
jgi:signal transduction histidine kinase